MNDENAKVEYPEQNYVISLRDLADTYIKEGAPTISLVLGDAADTIEMLSKLNDVLKQNSCSCD